MAIYKVMFNNLSNPIYIMAQSAQEALEIAKSYDIRYTIAIFEEEA